MTTDANATVGAVDLPRLTSGTLRGFDAEFQTLDQYIRVITERIWEGRRVDDIHTYYSDPCIVETPLSVSSRVADVITGTRATLAMFPDRRLLAEDILVSGDDVGGFLSSHRIISPMTHTGSGSFGLATGKRVHARTIADCVCRDNQIIHEWLVRDHAAIALSIGTTPKALAERWLAERGGWNKPVAGPAPEGYVSEISKDPDAQRYAAAIASFTARRFDAIDGYDEAIHQIAAGERHHYGRAEAQHYWQTLFGAFRTNDFTIEHLAINRAPHRSDRIALRWRAQTSHAPIEGSHISFGSATGNAVEILGINHAELVGGRVQREWVLVDEVALWMQLLSAQTK
jgi:predicted ester cyclase